MCSLPVIVPLVFSIFIFKGRYNWLSPSFSFINKGLRKDLLSLGLQFFLIQIAGIIIFTTTNILIAQLFDIGQVTTYNIAFKYYNITVIVVSILMSPLWGAFANAWHMNDVKWVVKNITFYLVITGVCIGVNLLQFSIYPYFIHFWLKREVIISGYLVFSLICYNAIFCYNDVFAHFLASVGQIKLQVYAAIAGAVINIPLTIYLAKHTSLGLSSILFANVFCLLPSSFVTTIQTIRIIREKIVANRSRSPEFAQEL